MLTFTESIVVEAALAWLDGLGYSVRFGPIIYRAVPDGAIVPSFDAPCLHTMCADKPMRGHGLMQAIARINRVFHGKPGGLVVDCLGVAEELRQALGVYTDLAEEHELVPHEPLLQEEAAAWWLRQVRTPGNHRHGARRLRRGSKAGRRSCIA